MASVPTTGGCRTWAASSADRASTEQMNALQTLQQIPDLSVQSAVPMSGHTSFGIGGPADILVVPHTVAGLAEAIRTLYDLGQHPTVIGNGTNMLVLDGGIRGVVVKIANGMSAVRIEGDRVVAESGVRVASLCRTCADHGLGGLEWAAGIPGTLGGALTMNAGANGGEIGQFTEWVRYITPDGRLETRWSQEGDFGYRSSYFQGKDLVIAQAGLRLLPGEPAELREKMCGVLENRCQKQPVAMRSAGCVFKRPEGDYAGRLLEEAGAKGMRVGDALVSPKHANFIVNEGNATADDVLTLIEMVRQRVRDKFGVDLVPEICVMGEPI